MIDINIDSRKYNNINEDISDDELIKAIKSSENTNQVSVIEYSMDKSKNIKSINFDDMNERNKFLNYYFSSDMFE